MPRSSRPKFQLRSLLCAALFAAGIALQGLPASPLAAQEAADSRPYDDKILRLSEILGAIHYLRELCGAKEGQVWREQMQRLLSSEGTSAIRRVRLVKQFNKGYRGYRRTYRSCTKSAELAVTRFRKEGAELADTLLKENR